VRYAAIGRTPRHRMRPCGSPSSRSVNGIPCASDLGVDRLSASSELRECLSEQTGGANFSSPSLCFTRMEPSRRSIPGLVERDQGRGFEYLHYPDAEPHITLGVTLPSPITTPVNGLGALISLIFGVNGPSRGGVRLG